MQNYTLSDCAKTNAEHPDTFFIPTQEEKEAIRPGDSVKLVFLGTEGGERMWVRVTGKSIGTLANNPFDPEVGAFGDTVQFEDRHILEITNRT